MSARGRRPLIAGLGLAAVAILIQDAFSAPADAWLKNCTAPICRTFAGSSISEDFSVNLAVAEAAGACVEDAEAKLAEARADYQSLLDPQDPAGTADVPGGGLPSMSLTGSGQDLQIATMVLKHNPPAAWPALAEGCQNALCALGKVFGSEEAALRVLNIAKRSGYVMSAATKVDHSRWSAVRSEPAQTWSLAEIRQVDQVIRKLPENFRRMSSMKYFYRAEDGWIYPGSPSTVAMAHSGRPEDPGRIVIYGSAFGRQSDPHGTIIHELGHQFDFSAWGETGTYFSASSGFDALSGWSIRNVPQTDSTGAPILDQSGSPRMARTWVADPEAVFVTGYAGKSPQEDFAESVAYYVQEPELLRVISPAKYALIRDRVFGGREGIAPDPWPAASRALQAGGGLKQVIEGCIGGIFQVNGSGETLVIREGARNSWTEMPMSRPENFFRWTNCLQGKFRAMALALADDPEYCERGGQQGIERYLMKKVKGPLLRVLFALKSQAQDRALVDACLQAKDLTRECRISQVSQAIAASVPGTDSRIQEFLRRHLPEAISPAMVRGLVANGGDLRMAIGCLKGFARIEGAAGAQARFVGTTAATGANRSGSLDAPSISADCAQGAIASLQAQGYRLPADARALSPLSGNPGYARLSQAFGASVVERWDEVERGCEAADMDCRRAKAMTLLREWARASGSDPAQVPEEFADHLLTVVRFAPAPTPTPL